MSEQKLDPKTQAIADKLLANYAVDVVPDSKVGVLTDKTDNNVNIFESTLPETVTPAAAKEVFDHLTRFTAAGTYAVGVLGVQAMADNKDLEEVTGNIKMMGRDRLTVNVVRDRTYHNHFDPEKPVVHKYGIVTTAVDLKAGRADSGSYKVARELVAQLGLEKLRD